MREFMYDITQLIKKYHNLTITVLFFGGCLILYSALPRLMMAKPRINDHFPSSVMQNTQFNSENKITLIGENLNHIIGVFINNIWEPDCVIISSTENQVEIILPAQYYSSSQDLDIQLETRINSDLTALSSKIRMTVLPSSSIATPAITSIEPFNLSFDGTFTRDVILQGSNFNENSVVSVNGTNYETIYEDGDLRITLPFSGWCNTEEAVVYVTQYYNGYPTTVSSNYYYLETDRKNFITDNPSASSSELYRNSQIMVEYLKALCNERYIAVLSVKDEASNSLTDIVDQGMSEIGLKQSLMGAQWKSYLAVIDSGTTVYEALGNELLKYEDTIDALSIHAESAGYYAGNISIIQINGVEYSLNRRGMNIVIYDKEADKVVDSICFDLYDEIKLSE